MGEEANETLQAPLELEVGEEANESPQTTLEPLMYEQANEIIQAPLESEVGEEANESHLLAFELVLRDRESGNLQSVHDVVVRRNKDQKDKLDIETRQRETKNPPTTEKQVLRVRLDVYAYECFLKAQPEHMELQLATVYGA